MLFSSASTSTESGTFLILLLKVVNSSEVNVLLRLSEHKEVRSSADYEHWHKGTNKRAGKTMTSM